MQTSHRAPPSAPSPSFIYYYLLFWPFSLQKWLGLVGEDRLQGPTIYRRICWQCYKSAFCFHRCSSLMASGILPKMLTLKVDREPKTVDRCRSSVSQFSTCRLLLRLFHPTPVRWRLFYMHENYLFKGLSQGQRAQKVKGALELRSPALECSEMGLECISRSQIPRKV